MERLLNKRIEKLDNFGRGIIREQGIIFVDDTLKDDLVNIEIVKDKKGIKEGRVINYLERSPYYRESVCPYSKECGGCHIINLLYQEQLNYKKNKVQELIDKMLKENIKVKDIISSNEEFNYRNKITLHGDNKSLGLYKKKTNDLVVIDECKLVDDKINAIIKRLKEYILKRDILIYEVTIKTTTLDEQMLIVRGRLDYEDFRKSFTDIKVIIINDQVITKDKYIKEKLLDKEFYISNRSFFQVNEYTTKMLYQKVIDLVKGKNFKRGLDLYCGTGTISLLISPYVEEVYGIEVVEDAYLDANRNKELNGINNVQFILGKTEDNLDTFNDIDLVIVDPIREGLDSKTRNNLKRIKPKQIVYVSCDPVTLMRDLVDLKELYEIEEINICDMFPNTYHVESVCVLSLR